MENILNFIYPYLVFALSFIPMEGDIDMRLIENISNPQQVILKSDEVILVKDMDIFEYGISSNSVSRIGERNENEFVGLDMNGDIFLCTIEHFVIDSLDEFSTKFVVKEKEYLFFETIRPIYMDSERIIAVTALDFLEQHYYEINLQSGEKVEIEEPERRVWNIDISNDIQMKKAYIWNDGLYLVEDIFGNLYLYTKRERIDDDIFTKIWSLFLDQF